MGSKPSKTTRPIPTETRMVITPRVPQEIFDEILNHLVTDSDLGSLQSCALVSKRWVASCRRHLFHTIVLGSDDMARWLKMFPLPEQSPAHHVRELRVWIGGYNRVPEKFFKYTQWFANVERMFLLGHGEVPRLRTPSLWRLPQSVTSLTINTSVVTLVQIRDIIVRLPNLDDLSLSGYLVPDAGRARVGIGTTLKGRFGGKLLLRNDCADDDVMNMLLETASGLRFTRVHIRCGGECLLTTVRLVEACSKTLVKLSCMVSFHGKYRSSSCPSRFYCAKYRH